MSGVRVAMIAAVGEDGSIGAGGALPWHLPTDFAHYKATTMGKPLVMGRKTFESIGRPLPGRTNIVVSRSKGFAPEGVAVFDTLDGALAHAKMIAARDGVDEVFVNGGGEIYRQAMGLADRLYITHVAAAPGGDTLFPPISAEEWTARTLPGIVPGPGDSAPFTIVVYERVRPPGFR